MSPGATQNLRYSKPFIMCSLSCVQPLLISPQEIGISVDSATFPPPDVIVHELFDSIVREIVEEVGITRDQMSFPVFTGLVSNLTTSGRCSMAFSGEEMWALLESC